MSPKTSVLFLWLVLLQEGASIRSVVTFTPDYQKIFTTETIRMTCVVRSTIRRGTISMWYKDNAHIHTGKSYMIENAEKLDSGNYQCVTKPGEMSAPARLDVSDDWVILQTPLYVYEGDEMTLRCHHYPGYYGGRKIFYKENKVITDGRDDGEFHISNVDRTSAGKYKCTKEAYNGSSSQYEDEIFVSVGELFSPPILKVSPELVKEGENMTITCDTNLTEHRQTTELQYAFYRDEENIQGFNFSNIYEAQFIKLENSGTYTCEIQTPNGSVKKRSKEVQIEVSYYSSLMIILSVSLGLLLLIIIISIFLYIYIRRRSSNNNPQPITDAENEYSAADQITYTELAMARGPQNHVPENNGSNVVYAVVNSKAKLQVKASEGMSATTTEIYQNISSYR